MFYLWMYSKSRKLYSFNIWVKISANYEEMKTLAEEYSTFASESVFCFPSVYTTSDSLVNELKHYFIYSENECEIFWTVLFFPEKNNF